MGKNEKRGAFEVYGDIISAINEEITEKGEARLTRAQTRSNVPYPRFKDRAEVLRGRGLVKLTAQGNCVRMELTDSGRIYLREYEHVKQFLRVFGLDR